LLNFMKFLTRRVNNKIGFGILDSLRMVETAKSWTNVGEQHVCSIISDQQTLASEYVIGC
jgi:hypothetical protein